MLMARGVTTLIRNIISITYVHSSLSTCEFVILTYLLIRRVTIEIYRLGVTGRATGDSNQSLDAQQVMRRDDKGLITCFE